MEKGAFFWGLLCEWFGEDLGSFGDKGVLSAFQGFCVVGYKGI